MKKANSLVLIAAATVSVVACAADNLADGFVNPPQLDAAGITNRPGVAVTEFNITKAWPWRTDPRRCVSEAQTLGGGRTVIAVAKVTGPEAERRKITPASVKRNTDYWYCGGMNYVMYSMPEEDAARWNADIAWKNYNLRCWHMLRQGRAVVDGFYFGGEKEPYPNRPFGRKVFGEWSDYTVLSRDALMASTVSDGKIVSPSGIPARFLLIPEYLKSASPDVMRKIESFADAGVIVIGKMPQQAFGKKNDPAADEEVRAISKRLEARRNVHAELASKTVYDAGHVQDYTTKSRPNVIHFHRVADDGSDIYFLSAQVDTNVTTECRFRVVGRVPEIWDPMTGRITLARDWYEADGMTRVVLNFPMDGSLFVVFRPTETPGASTCNVVRDETLPPAPVQKGRVVLAARGCRPPCAIMLSEFTKPSVRYAAEELRDHVQKITGVEMDIAKEGPVGPKWRAKVSLGLSDDPELGADGFEIKSTENAITVRGGTRGVIYGVHELLERYGGILWLSPDQTHIPAADSFSVPAGLSIRETPSYAERFHDNFRGDDAFATRCRLNETTYSERYGGPFPPFDWKLGKCHTFLRLVPPDKYYDTHPEYFSLVKGKRLRHHTQLCLTNPDVFDIVLSNVFARIEWNKTEQTPWKRKTRYYGISQDDWNNYCECEKCAAIDAQEESHSGCVIWFVNKVAEAVEKKYPDVIIETLAYMYGRKPPKNLKPRDNVMICLCTIECDFTKPMAINRYKENVDFRTNVLKWRDISKHLYIWDYAANWRATPVPYPNLTALPENIRFFHSVGVRYLFEEGISSPSASFTDLKGWLASKLMWNVKQPAEPLIRKFCEAYYGKGAPFVLDFIKLMNEQEIDETKTPMNYAVALENVPFKKEFYIAGRELWAKASVAAANDSEVVRKHVEWGRFGLEYALAGGYAQLSDWRAMLLSTNALSRLDRAEYMRMRESARYCQRMLDADPTAILSSRLNNVRYKGYLKAFAESEFPETAPQKALLQDWAFNYNDHPKSKTMSRVDDKDATDGRAILIKGEKESWSVSCPLTPILALDKGGKYKMRARIKVEPKVDAKPETRLLNMGMFDRVTKKTPCIISLKNSQATGKYEWYDMGEWTDEGHDCLMYMSPYGSNLSFDCIELSRLE